MKNVFGLFEIEKRAAHFGSDRAPRGFERLNRPFASRARGLHSALGREAVEQMPGRVHAHEITVVELRPGVRVALAVNFVTREKLNVRAKFGAVDQVLSIFDLDIDLARLPKDAAVDDIVYVPLETPLLAAANSIWAS